MRYVSLLLLALWACGGSGGPGTQPPAGVATVTVAPALDTLAPGQSAHFAATLKDAAGHVLTGLVAWSTSENATPFQYDSIGPLGDFGIDITAGATAGTAFLYATSEGVVGKATIVVVAPAAHDPYWGELLDWRTLSIFPDTALIVVHNWFITNGGLDSSDVGGGGVFVKDPGRCTNIATAQGYVGDYQVRTNLVVVVGNVAALANWLNTGETTPIPGDTLYKFTTGIFNPLVSPIPGYGDDLAHSVIWRTTLDNATQGFSIPVVPVAEPVAIIGDANWGTHCNL